MARTDGWLPTLFRAIEHNTRGAHRRRTEIGRRLGRAAGLPGLRRLATRPVAKAVLTRRQRKRVVALLAPEAERLRQLTGLPLRHWSV